MWRLRNRYVLINTTINQLYLSSNSSFKSGTVSRIANNVKLTNSNAKIQRTTCKLNEREQGCTSIRLYLQLAIDGASLNENKNILRLAFKGAEKLDFPLVWLRDNCQCQICYDKISHSRIHDQKLLRKDLSCKVISSTEDSVTITWEDGHVSNYSKEWLCRHSFTEAHQEERSSQRYIDRISWKAEDFEELANHQRYSFHDVLNDDCTLLRWLLQLAKYGISVLTGTPSNSGQVEKVAERIAFIRRTHYGEQFSVIGSDDANNVAYKKGALQLHTDLPYYKYLPGIVLLHCIKPSKKGGENILCDGLNAAMQLPAGMYQVLAETVVDWVDIGSHDDKKFYSLNREPVLCLNSFRDLEKINWSQPQRDSVFNVSPKKALEWYEAAIEFCRILHDRRNAVTFKSQPGDILIFDNRRILHGRADYTDENRLLYGAYIDWDEIYSRIRVLQNELKLEE